MKAGIANGYEVGAWRGRVIRMLVGQKASMADGRRVTLARQPMNLGDAMCIFNAHDLSVTCDVGSVWITLEDERSDITLTTGCSTLIDRHGKTVVLAMSNSVVSLHGRCSALKRRVRPLVPSRFDRENPEDPVRRLSSG